MLVGTRALLLLRHLLLLVVRRRLLALARRGRAWVVGRGVYSGEGGLLGFTAGMRYVVSMLQRQDDLGRTGKAARVEAARSWRVFAHRP